MLQIPTVTTEGDTIPGIQVSGKAIKKPTGDNIEDTENYKK